MKKRDIHLIWFTILVVSVVLTTNLVGWFYQAKVGNCVPGNITVYHSGAWYEDDGRAVILAAEEDSVPFCNAHI